MGIKGKILAIGATKESDIWISAAKSLGFEVILVLPRFQILQPTFRIVKNLVKEFYEVQLWELEEIHAIARQHDIVMTLCQPCTNFALRAVAHINSRLGLLGLSESQLERAGNKLNFHHMLKEHHLPAPKQCVRVDAIAPDSPPLPFPFVLKPNFGAGGVGIQRFRSSTEWQTFAEREDKFRFLKNKDDFYIAESFVEATYHVGINGAVTSGKLKILSHNVRDLREESWGAYFKENIFPNEDLSILSNQNMNLINKLIAAIGLNDWPLKIELFLDDEKNIISFIEVNLRAPGTRSPIAFSQILGIDYATELVKLASPFHTAFESKPKEVTNNCLMIKNFYFEPGTVKSIKWFEHHPSIVSFETRLQPGDVITNSWDVSTAQRNGELILVAKDKQELERTVRSLESQVFIEYE